MSWSKNQQAQKQQQSQQQAHNPVMTTIAETRMDDQQTGRKSTMRRCRLLLLLVPGIFTASMDLTIVATAQPFIASHYDALNQVSWVGTAYALTNTAFVLFFGQLADVFGRYFALQLAVLILAIGATISAASPTWALLLLGRAIQGVGTAGTAIVSLMILADADTLQEQAINTSVFHTLVGVAYATGPIIGGYLTTASWRFVFVLVASLGGLSIVTVLLLRPDLRRGRFSISRPHTGQNSFQSLKAGCRQIDFIGITLFTVGVLLVMLGSGYGGSLYPWASPAVIISLILGCLFIISFVVYQKLLIPGNALARHWPDVIPVIPFQYFLEKDVTLVCIISAATGSAISAAFYFGGVYFTVAEGLDAAKAGRQLLYYTPGIGIGAATAAFMCNVWPRQTVWPLLLGTIVETVGIGALTYAMQQRHTVLVNFLMAIAGFGSGIRFMPENLHLAGMYRDKIGPIYSLLVFAEPFGAALTLTLMGSVFQNKMTPVLAGSTTHIDATSEAAMDAINSLPPAELDRVREAAAYACAHAFIAILPFLAISCVAALMLGNVWVGQIIMKPSPAASGDAPSAVPTVETDGQVDVLTGSFLLALVRRRVTVEKRPGPVDTPLEILKSPSESSSEEDISPPDKWFWLPPLQFD